MKRLILMVTGMLFVSVMTVRAQSRDTVKHRNKEQRRVEHKYDRDKNKQRAGTQAEANVNMRDRKKVMVKEVPAALRQTLQGPEYKGWDDTTSTIYSDRRGNRYTVEIRNGANSKVYHFDKEGNRVDAGTVDRE
jgi:hypothetical protein